MTNYMDFSKALRTLKDGFLVQRERTQITIGLQKGYPDGIGCNKNTSELFNIAEGNTVIIKPYFQCMNCDGSLSNYVPTTEDILATDWHVVSYQLEAYKEYYNKSEQIENLADGVLKMVKRLGIIG